MNGNEGFFGAFEKTAFVVIIVLLLVIAWLNWQMALFGLLFVVVAYLYSSRAVCKQRQQRYEPVSYYTSPSPRDRG